MAILLYYPTKASPTTTITLNPALCSITRTEESPIGQVMEIAGSGREYVRSITANVVEFWYLDIMDMHEADAGSFEGITSLRAFIRSTLVYMENTFELEDDDGDTLVVRYISGLASLVEGGGLQRPQSRASKFSGTLLFRKTL